MRKIAIFGNAGGGKSTLAKAVSARLQLPLFALDRLGWERGGGVVSPDVYRRRHAAVLARDEWILDGYGSLDTLWSRLDAADTLVYVDLPLPLHFWWVTKRFLLGRLRPPLGWPENSPLLRSTLSGYRVLWQCHRRLTPRYRRYVQQAAPNRLVFHLRSRAQIAAFIGTLAR